MYMIFFSMWTFLVELAEIAEPVESTSYPNLMYSHGCATR